MTDRGTATSNALVEEVGAAGGSPCTSDPLGESNAAPASERDARQVRISLAMQRLRVQLEKPDKVLIRDYNRMVDETRPSALPVVQPVAPSPPARPPRASTAEPFSGRRQRAPNTLASLMPPSSGLGVEQHVPPQRPATSDLVSPQRLHRNLRGALSPIAGGVPPPPHRPASATPSPFATRAFLRRAPAMGAGDATSGGHRGAPVLPPLPSVASHCEVAARAQPRQDAHRATSSPKRSGNAEDGAHSPQLSRDSDEVLDGLQGSPTRTSSASPTLTAFQHATPLSHGESQIFLTQEQQQFRTPERHDGKTTVWGDACGHHAASPHLSVQQLAAMEYYQERCRQHGVPVNSGVMFILAACSEDETDLEGAVSPGADDCTGEWEGGCPLEPPGAACADALEEMNEVNAGDECVQQSSTGSYTFSTPSNSTLFFSSEPSVSPRRASVSSNGPFSYIRDANFAMACLGPRGVLPVFDLLKRCPCLRRLALNGNELDNHSVCVLINDVLTVIARDSATMKPRRRVMRHRYLRSLDLSDNPLGMLAGKALATMMDIGKDVERVEADNSTSSKGNDNGNGSSHRRPLSSSSSSLRGGQEAIGDHFVCKIEDLRLERTLLNVGLVRRLQNRALSNMLLESGGGVGERAWPQLLRENVADAHISQRRAIDPPPIVAAVEAAGGNKTSIVSEASPASLAHERAQQPPTPQTRTAGFQMFWEIVF